MAVSANALTLGQYAIMSNDPLVRRITVSLLQYRNVMADIPLVNRKTMIAQGVRWEGSLPTVDWVPVNSDPTVTSGTPTPYTEQAYIARNAIDTDRVFVEDENQIQDPRGAQVEAFLRAFTYDFNDKFINNDHLSGDVDSFVGLRYRINNGTAYGVRSENKINGGGVDMTQGAGTAATANNFLEFLDQLLWSVDSGDGTNITLYMNEVMKRRFARALRLMGTSGGYDITRDQFGRTVETFRNAVIADIGYKADQSTRIITVTEDAAGLPASSTFTSIYAVNYGTEHLFGWQFEPLRAEDIRLIGNAGATYRTYIEWVGGLYNAHTRSMARLYNIKMS